MQQCAMEAWGKLDIVPLHKTYPEMTPARCKRIELAKYDGVAPPVAQPIWKVGRARQDISGERVSQRRLWFEAAMQRRGDMHQRSTYFTEDEAIAWATQGLVRLKDVLRGTRVEGPSSFRKNTEFPIDAE